MLWVSELIPLYFGCPNLYFGRLSLHFGCKARLDYPDWIRFGNRDPDWTNRARLRWLGQLEIQSDRHKERRKEQDREREEENETAREWL